MTFDTLAIVGVGLIGGSIGLAARRRGAVRCILGIGRSAAVLRQARELGCIDEAADLGDAAARADLIVVCTPVDHVAEIVSQAARHARPGTVVSDAGSTKDVIVRALDRVLPPNVFFVGGHPLAGSEKHGPEHASADLFAGRVTVLTPTAASNVDAVNRLTAFWEALGSRVVRLSPLDHDDAVAMTSHLPHLAAAGLAAILPETLRQLTASGFRDTTRIAGGDADLWAAIFAQNRGAVLAAVARYREKLDEFRTAIEIDDIATLRRLLAEAKARRDSLDSPR